MSEQTNTASEEQGMSKEDYAKLRKEAIAHLREENKYLKVELEYEEIQAGIQEAKLRRMVAYARIAQLTTPPSEEEMMEQVSEEEMMAAAGDAERANPPKRKLKTENA